MRPPLCLPAGHPDPGGRAQLPGVAARWSARHGAVPPCR